MTKLSIEKFRAYHADHAELFAHLARGQSPKVLYIGCSDSRVDPLTLLGGQPGDVFVIRTAGNLVPDYRDDSGEAASIEFALATLPIETVIICGHSGCGAMAGLVNPEQCASLPRVKSWVARSQTVLSRVNRERADVVDQAARENVKLQLQNLEKYPQVQQRNGLALYGWYLDIGSGHVEQCDAGGKFELL